MAERHPLLLAALETGRPTFTHIGDGRYTSDFQITQPLGTWNFDDLDEPIHTGEFLEPLHSPTTHGYSYLALFVDRYQATAEAWLGRFPRTRTLRHTCELFPYFVHGDMGYKATITLLSSAMWKVVIEQHPVYGAVKGRRLLEVLPEHMWVGWRLCTVDMAEQTPGRRMILLATTGPWIRVREYGAGPVTTTASSDLHSASASHNIGAFSCASLVTPTNDQHPTQSDTTLIATMTDRHPILLAELEAGLPASTELADGRCTDTAEVTQPLGQWSFDIITDTMTHTGESLSPMHSAATPGYSYLALFGGRYQATAEAMLGSFPQTGTLRHTCKSFTYWTIDGDERFEATITLRDKKMWAARIEPSEGGIEVSQLLQTLPSRGCMVG
ncbi:hypothetical protein LTR10_003377 [Elasticomyces elasticus]|nr:hypothetical protein LTR10_003377 [Elasticomyces elasticus]KAK4969645.1 hypothetical protein LTR42_008917 [Elasticomyces elasticus]